MQVTPGRPGQPGAGMSGPYQCPRRGHPGSLRWIRLGHPRVGDAASWCGGNDSPVDRRPFDPTKRRGGGVDRQPSSFDDAADADTVPSTQGVVDVRRLIRLVMDHKLVDGELRGGWPFGGRRDGGHRAEFRFARRVGLAGIGEQHARKRGQSQANPTIGDGTSPSHLIVPAPPASHKRLGDQFGAHGSAPGSRRRERSRMAVDNRDRLGRQGPPLFSFDRPRFKMSFCSTNRQRRRSELIDQDESRNRVAGQVPHGTIRLGWIEINSVTCPW